MSADNDLAERRAEFGRRMRVRRIAGGIQIAAAILTAILMFVVAGVSNDERVATIAFMAIFGAFIWFAADGPADRLAKRVEAWLSGPP